MLKEEKELRGWVRASCRSEKIRDYHVLKLITALIRAVREDCAKVAEGEPLPADPDTDIVAIERMRAEIAAAIRGRK